MNKQTIIWIEELLAGTIKEDDFKSLQEILRSSSTAFDHYCHQSDLDGRLEWEYLGSSELPEFQIQNIKASVPSSRRSKLFAIAAILTLSVIGVLSWPWSSPDSGIAHQDNQPSPAPPSVGRITNSQNALWQDESIHVGSWIGTRPLVLKKGTAEITFDSGATVLLHAPTTLTPKSSKVAHLDLGKVTVTIPNQAAGFVLKTSTLHLTELDTSFGVATLKNGGAEVHAIEGQVELKYNRANTPPLILEKNQAVRTAAAPDRSAPDRILHNPAQFINNLPEAPWVAQLSSLHWSFDKSSLHGNSFTDTGAKFSGESAFAARSATHGTGGQWSVVPGPHNEALQLNGFGSYFNTAFSGIEGALPRTVAFWIRIPENTSPQHSYAIITWGLPDSGTIWRISWNPTENIGAPIGAIRTEFGDGYTIGTTDIRDGQWHHVASVFLGGKDASAETHIRHYIDGRLEKISASKNQIINTSTRDPKSSTARIGDRFQRDHRFRTFKGAIDEFHIFPAALTPQQINALYEENQIPHLFLPAPSLVKGPSPSRDGNLQPNF